MAETVRHASGSLLSPREVASRYPISISTLGRWRRRGCGPRFLRIGTGPRGRLASRVVDLEAFLVACEVATAPERSEGHSDV